MRAARAVAAAAIAEAARRKNDPADLINVALEKLVEGSFELPGYSTLDEMAAQIREEVNSSIFAAALEMARETVRDAGGFDEELARIDGVRATHGDNHVPLVARHFRKDRAAMLAMIAVLDLKATSADDSVLRLLAHVREHAAMTRDHIPDHVTVTDKETGEARLLSRPRFREGRQR